MNDNLYPAATIMLIRDNDAGQLEVLLLKRNRALAFAGGLWVFPGGKVEPEEIEKSQDMDEAACLAAIRETMEETQIQMQREQLIYFNHWTTPAIEPRRFSTWFFMGIVEENSTEVIIDDGEIKQYEWLEPEEALILFKKGKLGMMPPTFMSIQLIRTCANVNEAKTRLSRRIPQRILPVTQAIGNTVYMLYKGDVAYESQDITQDGPRHRMTMNPFKKEIRFHYTDCAIPPVSGGDDYFNV